MESLPRSMLRYRWSGTASPSRILFLQDHTTTGGAAIAANRIARTLRSMGHEVVVVAGDATPQPGTFRLSGKPPRGPARILECLFSGATRQRQKRARVESKWASLLEKIRPDLVWAHNLHGGEKWGWHPELLTTALARGPLIWTLHDMWALGNGPDYFPENELKERWPSSSLHHLESSGKHKNLVLLAPSAWLRDLVRNVADSPIDVWPNPLDIDRFHPQSREKIRRELGLRGEEILLISVAENLSDPRKNMRVLEEAWKSIRTRTEVRLAVVGRNCPEGLKADPRVRVFGPVGQEFRMAELMSAADLFVHPALMESHGLVLEESQACGTPVLAGAGGGMDDAVGPGTTGWRLAKMSGENVALLMGKILEKPEDLRALRPVVRRAMEQKHSPDALSVRWRNLLDSIDQSRRPA